MIMTKLGNQSNTTKIMFNNNEITDIYYRNNKVWENIRTANNVIDNQGNVASGTNITGGYKTLAPYLDLANYYYYCIGESSRNIYQTLSRGSVTHNCGTLSLGSYSGKYIDKITANICGAAGRDRLSDQSNAFITFIIKDNMGNILFSSQYRSGDYSSVDVIVFENNNITLNIKRIITSLKVEIEYSQLTIDGTREQKGPFNISFRSMNIYYKG